MTEIQIRIIRALQDGLPLSQEPFKDIAEKAGVSEEELLAQICAWKEDGTIRRFGAILRHREAGYTVNAMGVWNVPEDGMEDFGKTASEVPVVSHCYQRPRFSSFPFNLYTMIHGKSREDCESTAQEIAERTRITEYALLYTTSEFKKSSPVYFTNEKGAG